MNGIWRTSSEDVEQVMVEYFTNMFTFNGNTSYDKILDSIRGRNEPHPMCRLL